MSDVIMPTLAEQIASYVEDATVKGGYATVRSTAKALNVKQTEIRDNIPATHRLDAPGNGGLAESKILLREAATESESSESEETVSDEFVDVSTPDDPMAGTEPTPNVTDGTTNAVEGEGTATTAEAKDETPRLICEVCGNPVRRTTELVRGLCPLCFRELARQSGLTKPKILALSEEEFTVLKGNTIGVRSDLETYRTSRTLTKEQFEQLKDELIPVKEVFAAAKEKGYGPGRVAQAVGGDRMRHEPRGGRGSVWTPYYYGPRMAWYFDRGILDVLDELKREPKVKKVASEKDPTATRKGARGAKMTPVAENEGVPADADTAEMASTPA